VVLDSIDWLGHSGFRIRVGRAVMYIDPYRVPRDSPPADFILITHGHYDHFSPQDVERFSTRETFLVGPGAVAERVSGQVHSIAPGELLEDELVRGVHVAAVAAYNTSKRDPEGGLPHRGRGIALMEALMDAVELMRGNGGTTVRMERGVNR
jgi:L-ascorbate metabolism protein UlaG (beta-lactamase superfamily)